MRLPLRRRKSFPKPFVYLDALFVKIRDEGSVQKKAIYLALGLNLDGEKDLLGLWISKTRVPNFGCRC